MGEYQTAQKTFKTDCRNGNLKNVQRTCAKFGINFKENTEGLSGLMIAALYDKSALIDYFISNEANIKQTDHLNRTVLQMVILGFELKHFKIDRFKKLYQRFQTPFIKCKTQNQLHKINSKTMEYFLVNYLLAIRDEIISPNDPPTLQGLKMDDFMDYIELMPDEVLAPYRRKRQYVNSILSKNEIDREDKYNRKLFERKSRGCYNLDSKMDISYE